MPLPPDEKPAQPCPTTHDEMSDAATRRRFVIKMAKVAIVPAVIVVVDANTDPAHAY